ncbi:hypothetical protein LWP59_34980 [Amycolatopsis acidiphila]|uniref:Uncharacterized protein n=1 Tax=Amycolatopsis acidiphila TaxID=715473 RepID=A0A558A818_9PSEU|nr:hypothetical protein [Amycolatopsis acidiphila]TVT20401.1 hypothetical protein FNH06_20740 [Amycolatopsis acidiphila]UIJ59198.1 hypothetical protein LWP59_34980 [Amycolatopsis acidiphila]GHG79080.1 hypothetical protein GCM10017788_46830 [Amycolatopsis acidiphila]
MITGNHQRLSGGSPKAVAIVAVARRLTAAGVHRAADLREPTDLHKHAYLSVPGLGTVTWAYFLMLLGIPDVKADVWINRFVARAVRAGLSAAASQVLVKSAADRLGVSSIELDHAIWDHMRRAEGSSGFR